MLDADVVGGWVDNNSGNVTICMSFQRNFTYFSVDAKATRRETPDLDTLISGGQNNIIAFNGQQVGPLTILKYVRKIVTGDTAADKVINLNGNQSYLVSYDLQDLLLIVLLPITQLPIVFSIMELRIEFK